MNVTQLAGSLPRDPRFREWMSDCCGQTLDESGCAQMIREFCGVTSRREIATDAQATAAFEQYVRRPFVRWREQRDAERIHG
ncbi:hypothetical protein AWB76_03264 [Caballeronia temeraria]|uniref:Uncharacterized protein n=1 Tax=Caballeronia temeraria TaxID=1777137 RepID=A0A158AX47_9BURK|nr:hypothetical protein [Caballeronia temeraria]SAK62538.1 hypothetical protein AWB76_03264 [Caballeronia temeraria]